MSIAPMPPMLPCTGPAILYGPSEWCGEGCKCFPPPDWDDADTSEEAS